MTSPFDAILRPELSDLRAYVPHPAPADAIRLDANESPWDLDPEVKAELMASAARVPFQRYPDPRATALREVIAARQGCHPDEVVLGNGTDEVIAMILAALSRPREGAARATVLHPTPSFVMYRISSLALGLHPVGVSLDDAWDLDVPAMRDAIARERPNVVFLPSPNNPTGNRFSDDRVRAVLDAAPDALVLLDEAYGPFAGRGYDAERRARPNVGQLQTLSKIGFAALRCGWAILPAALAREVDKVRQPYNLDAVTQHLAREALTRCADAIDAAVARVVSERARLVEALRAMPGVEVTPSDANFVWIEVPGDAATVHAALLERGVLVRSFHATGGRLARRLRVTVGTPAEDDRFLDALRAALSY